MPDDIQTSPKSPRGPIFQALERLGHYGYFLLEISQNARHVLSDHHRLPPWLMRFGVGAVPLVCVVGLFAGAVVAWQAAYQFRGFASLSIIGGQTVKMITMELGPVLTGMVMAGRVGASLAAELGAMVATNQILALRSLCLPPVRFLVVPRVVAATLCLPILAMTTNLTGVLGSFVVLNLFIGISPEDYFSSAKNFVQARDVLGGIGKSIIFGFIISSVGCFHGLSLRGGSAQVGQATVSAFVVSCVALLAADYLLWLILF